MGSVSAKSDNDLEVTGADECPKGFAEVFLRREVRRSLEFPGGDRDALHPTDGKMAQRVPVEVVTNEIPEVLPVRQVIRAHAAAFGLAGLWFQVGEFNFERLVQRVA